ncbi:MAG: lipopolysaccharide heptosyltransferase II [Pseudomonadota bacterium]
MESILIIRLSAMGDVVMASPLIRALHRCYPGARVAWLVQPEFAALLDANPELDAVITWPRKEWEDLWRRRRYLRLAREVWRFRRRLRREGFDMVLDVHSLMKSGLLARLTGARRRVGLGSKEGSGALMTEVIPKPQSPRIGSEYLHLIEHLGCDLGDFEMDVALTASDRVFASNLMRGGRLEDGFVAFTPYTTRPQKHWFDDDWARLARLVHERLGLPVVILGGPADRDRADTIVRRAGDAARVINLAGDTSLREAAAVLERASLAVGVDTGLTHMAIAMDAPTIALFGSTCPYTDTGKTNTRVIYKALPCSPCRRRPTCDGRYDCMREITPDEVIAAAGELAR